MADPLGRTTTYEYGRAPGCNSCSYANTLTRITSPAGRVTTFSYDAGGLRTCQTVGAGTADAATTTYTYDAAKNLISVTDPRGKIWRYTYDDQHRKLSATDPSGNETRWAYDEHGNKLTETRPDGGVTQFVSDARNRLIETTDPAGHVTQMTYDSADNLLSLTDARNNTYGFAYDALNRKTSLTYPDGSHEDYAYDAVGNLATYTTRGSQVKTSTYDSRNRETAFTWSDSTPAVTKTYDAAGRVLTINSSVSVLAYMYDNANQLLGETQEIAGGPASVTVNHTYDADGNRATLTYPDGAIVAYSYTGSGRIASINSGGSAALANYAYDLNGNRVSKSLENGTSGVYTYDDANRLSEVKHANGGTVLAQFDYLFDRIGNRTQKTISGTVPNRTENYGYDDIDQVTSADYGSREETFEYDSSGNRLNLVDSASGTTTYSPNNLNQYTSVGGTAPVYDSNGNLASYASWTYIHDANNRLVSANDGNAAAAFAYDGLNRQVARTIDTATTYFVYDGWNVIAEYDSSGVLKTKYIHGARLDELLAKIDSSGSAVYYCHDALGSTVAITDASGTVLESYEYDAFGKVAVYDASGAIITGTAHSNRFLFTGREYLAQLGLYDYRNRIYS